MAAPFLRTTRALAIDSARPALALWALAVLVLAGWLAWLLLGQVGLVELSRQARLEVDRAPHPLAAVQAGVVVSSQLAIGRTVQSGELLLQLDDRGAQAQLAEARARVQGLPPRIASLQAEIAALQAAQAAEQATAAAAQQVAQARSDEAAAGADFAADQAQRLRAEARAGGGVAEIDARRAEAEARRLAAVRQGSSAEQQRLALDARSRASQGRVQAESLHRSLLALQADLASAQAAQASLAQALTRLQLRAPVAGVLAEVQALRPGSHVAEGQVLATVVPAGGLRVLAQFDPGSALGRLQPGQAARLRLDGYPWVQYGSVALRVQQVGAELRGGLLQAELALDGPPPAALPLQHGQPGVVEVDVERLSPLQLALRAAGRAVQPAAALR